MRWTLFLSLGALVYVYVGYPLLLRLVVAVRRARPVRRAAITPRVSLVISAYNEADVIDGKLENALALDYPADALEIVVVSDASSDGTDEIVRCFEARGVRLVRQEERAGKTQGLNHALPLLTGEIVVFSDANAFYRPDALRALVRNFADPSVGCVTGEARYLQEGQTTADRGERVYWNYEGLLKQLETSVASMVGGDGAIYAIRRHLWQPLPATAINDFLNPLQIVAAGWRAVYEPEAVCFERTAGTVEREYRRRIRIVSRSWRAVFQAPAVLNPFRVGWFTLLLASHKLLRWFSGLFLVEAGLAAAVLVAPVAAAQDPRWLAAVTAAVAASCALPAVRRLVKLGGYFVVISMASLVGVFKGTCGAVPATWATPRQTNAGGARASLIAATVFGGPLALVVPLWISFPHATSTAVFWLSASVLAYLYVGYPALVALLARLLPRPVRTAPVVPRVCLLVTAHNEQQVIAKKLQNALDLDYPADRLDILVVSDGSSDRTADIVREFAADGVRLMELSQRGGKPTAIAMAMAAIDADVVAFSDADSLLERDALRALVRNFADPTVGAVSADVSLTGDRGPLGASEDLYYRYERWLQRTESGMGSMIGADGGLYAIRRSLFVAPPADTILDDVVIPMAIAAQGFRVVLEPAARAAEQGPRTALDEFARKVRIAAGAAQFLGRGGWLARGRAQLMFVLVSHKALRWISPILLVAGLAAAFALAERSEFYAAAAKSAAVLLAFGVGGCLSALRRFRPIAVLHYFFLTHTAAVVGLIRGCAGRQAVTWRRFARAPR